jgi:hypothetical protein
MIGYEAFISIVIVAAFYGVLNLFLERLASLLRSIAARLAIVSATAAAIRGDCELIGPGIDAMNTNLYGVASALSDLGDAAESTAATHAAANS